jgi:hypothetical protein
VRRYNSSQLWCGAGTCAVYSSGNAGQGARYHGGGTRAFGGAAERELEAGGASVGDRVDSNAM